ncbi:hypothetical protein D3C85_1564190 [compost metagenome]
MMEGMASMMNSHCQPASPEALPIFAMIQPDSGPPMTPDTAMADMKTVMIFPRIMGGNQ